MVADNSKTMRLGASRSTRWGIQQGFTSALHSNTRLACEHVEYGATTFSKPWGLYYEAVDVERPMPGTILFSSSNSSNTFAANTLRISTMPIQPQNSLHNTANFAASFRVQLPPSPMLSRSFEMSMLLRRRISKTTIF